MNYNIEYIPSEKMEIQGSKSEIFKKYGKEWHIREQGSGNGNWLLIKKSNVLINNKSYRKEVLKYYGREKLTEKLVNRLRKEIEDRHIPDFLKVSAKSLSV
ncbi:hypothetical protein [Mitsuokella jalaludinii]|uniref:hypothetical protein n=1 Tax=Mitsuokella jalaludinii TaxID=187979 RepID=UPI00298C3E2C|nr:hypothetical protein [Mitsuokella jalaludinii]